MFPTYSVSDDPLLASVYLLTLQCAAFNYYRMDQQSRNHASYTLFYLSVRHINARPTEYSRFDRIVSWMVIAAAGSCVEAADSRFPDVRRIAWQSGLRHREALLALEDFTILVQTKGQKKYIYSYLRTSAGRTPAALMAG